MGNKIIDRLFEYLIYKGIPHTRFEKEIGLSNGYLNTQKKRKADLGESVILKIIENSLDINLEWLLTGKGSMLAETEPAPILKEGDTYTINKLLDKMDLKDKKIEDLSEENGRLKERLKIQEEKMKEMHSKPTIKGSIGLAQTKKSGVAGLEDARSGK